MPVARSADGVVAPLTVSKGGTGGLLEQYSAGVTGGLLVFVGHVERRSGGGGGGGGGGGHGGKKVRESGGRLKVTLSLPKTESGTLILELLPDGALRVRYCEPIAPLIAFHAALSLLHWLKMQR